MMSTTNLYSMRNEKWTIFVILGRRLGKRFDMGFVCITGVLLRFDTCSQHFGRSGHVMSCFLSEYTEKSTAMYEMMVNEMDFHSAT